MTIEGAGRHPPGICLWTTGGPVENHLIKAVRGRHGSLSIKDIPVDQGRIHTIEDQVM
ncbi:hypothetical protein [Micromonospora sp. NPDC049679]|uniref:hypothetical protein n=1 Tax=Micromonospora sp. NPDC049679 TaxID=3155920 RepID=UPI0033E46C3F